MVYTLEKIFGDLLITFYKNVASIVEENDSPANAGETKFYDTL